MGLRELLILILILAIVAVSLRGLYVALKARRGQLRMQLEKNIPQYDPDELLMSELPNGGARLVERSFAAVVKQNSQLSARDRVRYAKNNGNSAIPVLMEPVNEEEDAEHEEEEAFAPRQSSVASAREAARQKHLQTQAFKPVQRPIDHLAAQAASSEPEEEQEPAEDYHDFYEDPLDASPLSVDDDPLEEADDQEDEGYDDESVDDDAEDFDDSDYEDDEDYDDYDEDDEDFEDEEAFEDDFDEPADDVHAQDYVDPDDFDDDDDDEEDEESEPEAYADEQDDEEWSDDEDLDGWEDENDAEDEERDYADLAEEFDDVYGEQGADEDAKPAGERDALLDAYDDPDDAWDDEAEPEQQPVSAPRRWLKWAGEKLSGMGATHEEPVRERDFHSNERSEPLIALDALDEDNEPAPEPARKAKPAAKAAEPARRSREPLDRSRQTTLFDDEHDMQDEIAAQAQEKPAAREPLARHKGSSQEPEDTTVKGASGQEYSEVLVINVMAKPDREFAGVDLLPALLGLGLRFGEMNIFHRHVDQKADSPVLFSVANMINPGTFDLNMINDFSTRGVCFFMTLPNVANSMQAFDRMLDAAQHLRMTLDGELKDDIRSVMTAQTIEHYRQRVRDFDLRQLRQHK